MAQNDLRIEIAARFPADAYADDGGTVEQSLCQLTRRDYFAGQALAGMMANTNSRPRGSGPALIELCVSTADDLMAALDRPEPQR